MRSPRFQLPKPAAEKPGSTARRRGLRSRSGLTWRPERGLPFGKAELGPGEALAPGPRSGSTFSSSFLAALGLGAAGGTGAPEYRSNVAALGWPASFCCRQRPNWLGLPLQPCFCSKVLAVVAQIRCGANARRLGAPTIWLQKPRSRRCGRADDQQGAHPPLHRLTFQPTGWFSTSRWLGGSIKQQQVRVLPTGNLAQGDRASASRPDKSCPPAR